MSILEKSRLVSEYERAKGQETCGGDSRRSFRDLGGTLTIETARNV
jgi:hypothetical protein